LPTRTRPIPARLARRSTMGSKPFRSRDIRSCSRGLGGDGGMSPQTRLLNLKRSLSFIAVAALTAISAAAGPFPDYNQGIQSNDARIVGWATGWQDTSIRHQQRRILPQYTGQSDSIDNAILGAPTISHRTAPRNTCWRWVMEVRLLSRLAGHPNSPGGNFAVFENAFLDSSSALAGRGGGTNYVYFNSDTNRCPWRAATTSCGPNWRSWTCPRMTPTGRDFQRRT